MKKLLFLFCLFVGVIFSTLETVAQEWRNGYSAHFRHTFAIEFDENHNIFTYGGHPQNDQKRTILRVFDYGVNWYNWEVIMDELKPWIQDAHYIDPNTVICVGHYGNILRSQNAAQNWDSIPSGTEYHLKGIHLSNETTGFCVGGDSLLLKQLILKTIDGGLTWTTVRDVDGTWLRGVHSIDVNIAFAVGDNGVVLKTSDGGSVWNSVSVPISRDFKDIIFLDASNGYIVGGNMTTRTILRTVNGGLSWTIVLDEAGGLLNDVDFINASIGYAVGDFGQVLKTIDGGQNWEPLVIPEMTTEDHFNTVNFQSENFGMVAGQWGRYFMYTNFPDPIAQTGPALAHSGGMVTFNGAVNSGGATANTYFVYSTSPDLSNADSTMSQSVHSNSFTSVMRQENGLNPNTTYYYTIKASHVSGWATGDTLSFFTDFATGVNITTDQPTSITSTSAILNGTVSGLTGTATVWFDYNAFGESTISVSASPASISNGDTYHPTASITGLTPNTTYRFRIRIETGQTSLTAFYAQFYTGTASVVQTYQATNISTSGATLNGEVQFLHLPSNLYFEYWPEGGGPQAVINAIPATVSDENLYSVTAIVSNLQPNTYYQCRLTAQNSFGMVPSNGQVQFYTGIENAVITDPAVSVMATSATLRGRVQQLSSYPATAWFEYINLTSDTILVAANPHNLGAQQLENLEFDLSGLSANSVYRFRVKAIDNDGVEYHGKWRQVHTGINPIPNNDFEDWQPISGEKPIDWFNVFGPVEKISPGYNGNHAVKLEYLDGNHIGALMNGAILDGQGEGPGFAGGVAYNSRPDTLSGMFRYDLAVGDSATVIIVLRSQGQIISQQMYLFGGSSPTNYVQHKFPISYSSSQTPDTLMIGMIAANLMGGGEPQSGDWIIADELKFTGNHPDIPNFGFELWNAYSIEKLEGWSYNDPVNFGFYVDPNQGAVRKTLDMQHGNAACEIRNIPIMDATGMNIPSGFISGAMNTTTSYQSGNPSFPINHRPQALHGFYKFFPENGDSLKIACRLYGNGSSSEGRLFIAEASAEYSSFTVELDSQVSFGGNPDSATIDVSPHGDRALGASLAILDHLRFDGFEDELQFPVSITQLSINESDKPALSVFPNPATDMLNVKATGVDAGSQAIIRIVDPIGRIVLEERVLTNSDGIVNATLSINGLRSGIYQIQLFQTVHSLNALWLKL